MRRDVLDFHGSTVLFNNFLHDYQAETGAFRFGRYIRLKCALHQLLGKTAAVVGDDHAHSIGARLRTHHYTRICAVHERVLRVLQQVVDYLTQLRRVADEVRETGRELASRRDPSQDSPFAQ